MADPLVELKSMQTAFEALKQLDAEGRRRALGWLADSLGVEGRLPSQGASQTTVPDATPGATSTQAGQRSQLSGMSPKDFLREKRPSSAAERIACLAYYLAHARNQTTFKTPDIVGLNTEAAAPRIANASRDVDNAERGSGYLVTAGSGQKQISARGEALVQALPDRDAAARALEDHPHRRRSKKAAKKAPAKKAPTKAQGRSAKTTGLPKA